MTGWVNMVKTSPKSCLSKKKKKCIYLYYRYVFFRRLYAYSVISNQMKQKRYSIGKKDSQYSNLIQDMTPQKKTLYCQSKLLYVLSEFILESSIS